MSGTLDSPASRKPRSSVPVAMPTVMPKIASGLAALMSANWAPTPTSVAVKCSVRM